MHARRPVRDYDWLPQHSEALITLAAITLKWWVDRRLKGSLAAWNDTLPSSTAHRTAQESAVQAQFGRSVPQWVGARFQFAGTPS